jgi:hypothetical protein
VYSVSTDVMYTLRLYGQQDYIMVNIDLVRDGRWERRRRGQ